MSSKKLVKGYKKEETSSRAIEVVDLSYLLSIFISISKRKAYV